MIEHLAARSAVDLASRRVDAAGPLEILRQVGGAELVAIAGATYEARIRSIPVLLDGFVVTSACAALEAISTGAIAHVFAGHCSAEPGHRILLDKLGLQPILELDLRLGEGSGAMAALPLVRLAALCVTEVATFGEWGIKPSAVRGPPLAFSPWYRWAGSKHRPCQVHTLDSSRWSGHRAARGPGICPGAGNPALAPGSSDRHHDRHRSHRGVPRGWAG